MYLLLWYMNTIGETKVTDKKRIVKRFYIITEKKTNKKYVTHLDIVDARKLMSNKNWQKLYTIEGVFKRRITANKWIQCENKRTHTNS